MRLSGILFAAGTASLLVACAGKSPAPSNGQSAPGLLASWNTGSIDQAGWDNWKKSAGIAPQTPETELPRIFTDYVRYQLDAQAAVDAGVSGDKTKADRWASIVDRILSDKVRRDILGGQHGFSDAEIQKWAAAQDSVVRKLPEDSLRARGGRALALSGAKLDSVYQANKESFKKDSVNFRPFDSVKNEVAELYLRNRTEKKMRDFLPDLRTRYGVKLVSPVRPDPSDDSLMSFWKNHSDLWSSQPVYRLVALGSKDSTKLAKALASIKKGDAAAFKKLASKFPVGTPVAPEGVLGRVKHQFALPYGIGMVPELFSGLESAKAGTTINPFKANDSLYLAVYLEAKDSATVKPYASVKADVLKRWMEANPWTPASIAVLATWDKGALFTKGDVDFISEEVPPQMRRQFPADRVLDFMINWKVAGRYSREIGHDTRTDVRQAVSDNEKIYWAQEWRQTAQAGMFLFEKKDADAATTFWKDSLFAKEAVDSGKGANRDGARLLLLGKTAFHEAYLVDLDKYRTDSVVLPYDSVRGRIFGEMRSSLDEKGRDRIDSVLKARYGFKLYPAAPQAPAPLPFATAFDSARAAHDRRALDQAEALYRQVEKNASAPDSVRAQALFQLGQLYGEQQNYPRSLSSYRAVLVRFGNSNEAYKAQFMIAFTFSEYLKNEKAALLEYGKMLVNYPKSDLTDDADWMIRNIKSGGALMPKFDDSAFVADSVARADSLKKANAAKVAAPVAPKAPEAAKPDTAKKSAPVKADTAKKTSAPAAAKTPAAPKVAKQDTVKKVVATKLDTAKKTVAAVATKAPETVKAKVDTAKKTVVPAAAKAPVAPKAKVDSAKKAVAPVAAKATKVDTAKAGAKK